MYARAGCHLCDQARSVIETVCAETGESWTEIDIDSDGFDTELRERFTDEVPVTFVDGRQHDFWRVHPERLRAALAR